MQNAFAEIVKERDRLEREITTISEERKRLMERAVYRRKDVRAKKALLAEYDQIIEKLKGVTV